MKSVLFLCGGYRSIYPGNFIPSLQTIESRLRGRYNCIYIFHKGTENRDWCKKLMLSGHIVEIMDFDEGLLKRIKAIRRIARKHEAVLIHVHFGDKLAATLYGRFSRVEVVWHWRTDGSCGKRKGFNPGDIWSMVREFIGVRLIGRKAVKIAVSADLAKKISGIYIPNGLVLSRIDSFPAEKRREMRRALGVADDVTFVLLFGWSTEIKGVDIAVQAVRLLQDEGMNQVELGIVCGTDNSIVKNYINAHCGGAAELPYLRYLPPAEDVFRYHNSADIFLSASRSEGFSNALCEALSIGKPCVSSDIKGVLWTKEYKSVVFFSSGDGGACRDAIKTVMRNMQDEGYLQRCRTDAIQFQRTYNAEIWAERVIKAYNLPGLPAAGTSEQETRS